MFVVTGWSVGVTIPPAGCGISTLENAYIFSEDISTRYTRLLLTASGL